MAPTAIHAQLEVVQDERGAEHPVDDLQADVVGDRTRETRRGGVSPGVLEVAAAERPRGGEAEADVEVERAQAGPRARRGRRRVRVLTLAPLGDGRERAAQPDHATLS